MDENNAAPYRGEGEAPIPEFSSLPRQVCFISALSGMSKESRLTSRVVYRLFRLAAERSGAVLDPRGEQLQRAHALIPLAEDLYIYRTR